MLSISKEIGESHVSGAGPNMLSMLSMLSYSSCPTSNICSFLSAYIIRRIIFGHIAPSHFRSPSFSPSLLVLIPRCTRSSSTPFLFLALLLPSRYRDIVPFDHARVVLAPSGSGSDDVDGADYINASFLKLPHDAASILSNAGTSEDSALSPVNSANGKSRLERFPFKIELIFFTSARGLSLPSARLAGDLRPQGSICMCQSDRLF